MRYKKLGKLPMSTIDFFKQEILKRQDPNAEFQRVQFEPELTKEFLKIFCNTELQIQYDPSRNRSVQKAFCSAPGHGFRIHRDGLRCQSALNIAISCNPGDWVRWYDDAYIDSIATITETNNDQRESRNVAIMDYEDVPYIDELRNEVGDVYVLDVESYHSFKCNGPEPRIILQTKFEGYPVLETILKSLSVKSFTNIIQSSDITDQ